MKIYIYALVAVALLSTAQAPARKNVGSWKSNDFEIFAPERLPGESAPQWLLIGSPHKAVWSDKVREPMVWPCRKGQKRQKIYFVPKLYSPGYLLPPKGAVFYLLALGWAFARVSS